METTETKAMRTEGRRFALRAGGLGAAVLLLMIPLAMIRDLTHERGQRQPEFNSVPI